MDPGGFFVFLPIKWAIATSLVAAGVSALLLERRALPQPAASCPWLALLSILTLSAITGIGGWVSWAGYPGRYLGVFAWIVFFAAFVLGSSIDEDGRTGLLRAVSVGALVVSLYALLQAAGIDPISWNASLNLGRTRSTLGNAAFLGAYLAMIVPLAVRLAFDRSDGRWRGIHATTAMLASVALVTTQTRGAWLGAAAGIALVLVLERRRLVARPRVTAAAAVAALFVIALLATVSPYASRIRSIADPAAATGRGRLVQWERTLDMIGSRPYLGWGPDTYASAFPRFIDAHFERTVGRDVVPDRAHNVALDIASSSGILGAAAYAAVLGSITVAVARSRRRDPATVALASACAAYIGQLMFSFPVADLDVVFWLLAGILVAPHTTRWRSLHPGWSTIPLMLALVLAGWGGADAAADRTLRGSLDAEASGSFAEAQRLVDRAARLAPGRAQYDQAAARLHRRAGEASGNPADFVRGLEALQSAQRLSPNDLELAMDKGDLYLAWGEATGERTHIARAASTYERVLAIDRESSRARLKLGVAYAQLERSDDAEREWRRAAVLAPTSRAPLENLAQLYDLEGRQTDARRVRERIDRLEE